MSQAMSVLTSQVTNEWYTPSWLIDKARMAMGGTIELDVASSPYPQTWIKAKRYYALTIPDGFNVEDKTLLRYLSLDQLDRQVFKAKTLWCNPPFDCAKNYSERLYNDWCKGIFEQGLLLVNSAPGYNWFERLWRQVPVVMLRERVHFVNALGHTVGSAKKGSCIASLGVSVDVLNNVFGNDGRILIP